MYLSSQQLVLSPSDLVAHTACAHLTTLNREVALGRRQRPVDDDPGAEVIRRLGDEHEQEVLEQLRSTRRVVSIPPLRDPSAGEALTVAAMHEGADVIYQATFFDRRWRGHADFLLRRDDRPSKLGDWYYDVADTKLARRLRVSALLQMGVYATRLEQLQGVAPRMLTVILGSSERVDVAATDVTAYTRRAMSEFEQWLAAPPAPTYPVRVPHCKVCPWARHCQQQWRADDDLVLVPSLRRDQREHFRAAGIDSITRLAAAAPAEIAAVGHVGVAAKRRLATQARLQVAARSLELPPHEPILPVQPSQGLAMLPQPDPGDLFLDLEGDPFYGEHGLEYLWGVSDAHDRFTAWWGHDPAAEQSAFEQAVDHIMATWRRYPGMHVYHYASYEPARLKDLSQRYGSRIDEIDALLRGERLVDLYAVVRNGLRIGVESYSIKSLEPLYGAASRGQAAVKDAGSSIVEYERWRVEPDQAILDAIESYNRDDCISTRGLRDWLELRRAEVVGAGYEVPRPGGVSRPEEHLREADPAVVAARLALTAGIPADPSVRSGEQNARLLLADLLELHRREARAEWWEYFRVRAQSGEELEEDAVTLAGLSDPVLAGQERQSGIWRYSVPPQECKLVVGARVDHSGHDGGSSILRALDLDRGQVELMRGMRREHPHPTALWPQAPVDTKTPAAALARVARWVVDNGIDGPGRYRGVRDLLLGRPPRFTDAGPSAATMGQPGEDGADTLARVAPSLAGVLPVQGPPGSGKTYAGSHAVVALVRAGRTVGICANSHRVITSLLDAVMAVDDAGSRVVRAIQKTGRAGDGSDHDRVDLTSDNATVEVAITGGTANVVAGTSWLFARDDVHVDVLVVDEAGQLSLANTIAAGAAADALILLGDPQQLRQPAKGTHPAGADASSLEHVLGGHDTVPADRGLFLGTTRRMHPAVCTPISELFYEARLHPVPGLERQLLGGSDDLAGAGLRWRPVRHTGRSVDCPEEVEVVAELLARLDARQWTDASGCVRALGAQDVLVVAPYNAQVAKLRARLDTLARIGTVDKFQGQQAPVVIVSLTTSSALDAPRGVDFVANRNRLNVAVSRARSLAILVGSPALLSSPAHSVPQLQGINALCRLVEAAE